MVPRDKDAWRKTADMSDDEADMFWSDPDNLIPQSNRTIIRWKAKGEDAIMGVNFLTVEQFLARVENIEWYEVDGERRSIPAPEEER